MSSSVDYRQIIQSAFDSGITGYYEDSDVRDLVDLLQGTVSYLELNFHPKLIYSPL